MARMNQAWDQRGMSGSVQAVVLLPFAFTILLLLIQWALVAWADATALAAAQEAAARAAALGGSPAEGRAAGLGVAGNGSLHHVRVEVLRGAQETSATVTGQAMALVWPREIEMTAVAATERVTGP